MYKLQKTVDHKRFLQEAKVQLKNSKLKDYYKILGVEKTAGDDEIKKAYRKKALLHHPGKCLFQHLLSERLRLSA